MTRAVRVALLLIVATTALAAQYNRASRAEYRPDIDHDGRIAFARIAWQTGSRYGGGWSSAWNHDYLRAEQHLSQILREMRRVLPEGRWQPLDQGARIFNSFFAIKDMNAIVHPMSGLRRRYLGLFEDNDPQKPLMVVANFDNDVMEYWEWSGEGMTH